MSIQETKFKAIADAIRAKTGETGTIVANDFATKIASIPSGGYEPGQAEFGIGPTIMVSNGQYTLSTIMQVYGYDDIRSATIIKADHQSAIFPESGNTAFFENLTNGELDGVTFENWNFGAGAPVLLKNVNAKIKFKNCIFEMGQSFSMIEHSFVDLVLESCMFS